MFVYERILLKQNDSSLNRWNVHVLDNIQKTSKYLTLMLDFYISMKVVRVLSFYKAKIKKGTDDIYLSENWMFDEFIT